MLLDNFVTASAKIEEDENHRELEEQRRRQQARNPLEPLLKKLAKEYVDDADLSDKLHRLYKVGRLGCSIGHTHACLEGDIKHYCPGRIARAGLPPSLPPPQMLLLVMIGARRRKGRGRLGRGGELMT